MTLTPQKRQVHCYGVMLWWACNSFMSPPLPAEADCERIFYYWCLLHNNIMATNLQRFASWYGSRRFACMWLFNVDLYTTNWLVSV